MQLSAELGAGGDGVVQQQEVQLLLALFLVDGGDQHTAAGDAHHLPGRQIQNRHGGLSDELFRLIVVMDARENGAVRAAAVVQGELQQLVALFTASQFLIFTARKSDLQKVSKSTFSWL